MELKDFQQSVLDTLDRYLDELAAQHENYVKIEKLKQENPGVEIPLPDFTESTWVKLLSAGFLPAARADIAFSPRKDGVHRPVPAVSLKIPTGGGKTLLAANAVSRIMGKWVRRNSGFVLWIVPNESIYFQTKKALTNREHPYRHQLDKAAAGRVKILEKNDALNKRDVESHLCVMLLMLQAANRESKESLRMFRDRGNVHGFFPAEDDYMVHHEVLKGMIKLPINVTVRGGDDWRDCLRESYECLNGLQKEADQLKANADRYIRPICLVQVERTGKDQRESGFIHAEAVREYLLTLGVREQEIAVKTSEKNELKDPEYIDLLNPACQVRFIITKQALQEGWDCPFAYVLCSLAPTTNKSAMTQLVGRILRQPDTVKTGMARLDECYVICFHDGEQAVSWWHRNIAKRHYSLQGWRKHKVYPDFIFAMTADGAKQRLLIIERNIGN